MILNIHLTSIETKVYMKPEEMYAYHAINIQNEININNPSVAKSSNLSGEIPILKVEWSLSVNYLNPSLGYIRFKGTMNCHYKDPESMITVLPVDVRNEISNTILTSMAAYLIETAKFHSLPSPIPIPKVDFGQATPQKKTDNDALYG